jgi:hypothetical protein
MIVIDDGYSIEEAAAIHLIFIYYCCFRAYDCCA